MRAGSDERRSDGGGRPGLAGPAAANTLTVKGLEGLGLAKELPEKAGARRSSVDRRGRHLLSIDGACRQGGSVAPAPPGSQSALVHHFHHDTCCGCCSDEELCNDQRSELQKIEVRL